MSSTSKNLWLNKEYGICVLNIDMIILELVTLMRILWHHWILFDLINTLTLIWSTQKIVDQEWHVRHISQFWKNYLCGSKCTCHRTNEISVFRQKKRFISSFLILVSCELQQSVQIFSTSKDALQISVCLSNDFFVEGEFLSALEICMRK